MQRAVRQAVRAGQPGHGEEGAEQQVVAVHQQQLRFGHRRRGAGFYGLAATLLTLVAGIGCAPAAWEEHHRVGLDGSGQSVFRVRPGLLPGAAGGGTLGNETPGTSPAGVEALRPLLSGPGLRVERVLARRDGRLESVVEFDSLAALCGAPLLRRDCSYEGTGGEGFELAMTAAARPGAAAGSDATMRPDAAPPSPEERAEVRVRLEGRITWHNSDGPLQRGNVLAWVRPLDRFFGEGLDVRVETDRTSVFAATTRIVLRAALIALGIVGTGLTLLVLEGRRRLPRERQEAG